MTIQPIATFPDKKVVFSYKTPSMTYLPEAQNETMFSGMIQLSSVCIGFLTHGGLLSILAQSKLWRMYVSLEAVREISNYDRRCYVSGI